MSPAAAHISYGVVVVSLCILAWGVHELDTYMHMGPLHYLVFLLPIWEAACYLWHCFIKKDYVFVYMGP